MKKDCIQDFVKSWRDVDGPCPYFPPWNRRFRDAGYYHAVFVGGGDCWREAHQWCVKQFGAPHYAWVGNDFWFETDKDAMLFTLRWS